MTATIATDQSLASLVESHPGAARVFFRHRLDFCCGGRRTLAEAAAARGLDPAALAAEIAEEDAATEEQPIDWSARPLDELIDHILERFHEGHRREVPRLLELARKCDRVHGGREDFSSELLPHLERVAFSLEEHMQKEEQVLFPMLRAGVGRGAAMPINVMMQEHDDHGANLTRTRELCNDFRVPEDACTSWRALYAGLEELEQELMRHVHIENNVLFPRVLAG